MILLMLIAQICGQISSKDLFQSTDAKNCYKRLLNCIEHKQIMRPKPSDEEALKACVLEM
jgi:hypothetical protein